MISENRAIELLIAYHILKIYLISVALKYSPNFDYNNTARFKIFRREQSEVTDLKSKYKLMRFNDFKNDSISQCDVYNQTCSPPFRPILLLLRAMISMIPMVNNNSIGRVVMISK
jgi:hypothetical protein